MRSIFKTTIFVILCGLFMMQSDVSAQKSKQGVNDKELKFPVVEGWEMSEKTVYPTPELGYSVAYDSELGGTVTIYVYNGGLKKIPDSIEDKILTSQMDQAKSDIKQYGKLGYYENVKEINNGTVMVGGLSGKVKALHSSFNFTIKGRDVDSEIYLFGYQNNFVKIRATRPQSEGDNKALTTLLSKIDAMFAK